MHKELKTQRLSHLPKITQMAESGFDQFYPMAMPELLTTKLLDQVSLLGFMTTLALKFTRKSREGKIRKLD